MPRNDSLVLGDEVRAKTRLSKLIGEDIKLEPAGSEFKGLCPFHDEKTPSFYVNDKKMFYHCFGCGAHGDAINWIERRDKISRSKAIYKLAELVGISPKKGGGKLNRSETVTVRLDPKLNYLAELAARSQRRTKSSFIEWAVAEALGAVRIPEVRAAFDDRELSVKDMSSDLWHVDEADRLVALAINAPALMTHDEQLIWRLMKENGYLWKGRYNSSGEWTWEIETESIILDRAREYWEIFKSVATGEESEKSLPTWTRTKADDLDDGVPF